MSKKQPRVPEMRDPKSTTNREMRRHPEKIADEPLARDDAGANPATQDVVADDRPQDVASVRAKNSGHGKKTADKWNQ